jgi:hypothetical protein
MSIYYLTRFIIQVSLGPPHNFLQFVGVAVTDGGVRGHVIVKILFSVRVNTIKNISRLGVIHTTVLDEFTDLFSVFMKH